MTMNRAGALPLRLMLGIGFIIHGLPKFGAGHQMFLASLQGMGLPQPELTAWLIAVLEVGGGLLLLVGYQVRIVAILFSIEMLVAIIKVHAPSGFNAVNITSTGPNGVTFGMPGFEFPLLYLAMLVSLTLSGAGSLSLDERTTQLAPPRRERASGEPMTAGAGR